MKKISIANDNLSNGLDYLTQARSIFSDCGDKRTATELQSYIDKLELIWESVEDRITENG
jgi:hypothetical protein